MNRNEKEVLEIGFSENFSEEDINEIIEAFSKIVKSEPRHYVRLSAEELPAVLIFILGVISGSVASGFFGSMGSDLYQKAKEKVIRILRNKKDPTLEFKMHYKNTEIIISSKTKYEQELSKIFDTINKAREIAIAELDKKDTPEMTKIKIVYDDGKWVLDSGECWKPLEKPRIIRFYEYDKSSGKWKLIKDWSE